MSSTRSVRPLGALVRVGLCASLVFGAASCGGDDDGDTRTIRNDDGEITVSGDGSEGVLTGPDGEETRFSAGDGAKLPEGWPEEIAFPDGTEVLVGTSLGGGETLSVQGVTDGEVADVYGYYKALLTDQGFELTTDTLADLGDETMASLSGEADGLTVAVILMSDAEDESRVSISAVVETRE